VGFFFHNTVVFWAGLLVRINPGAGGRGGGVYSPPLNH
jgi:hypothetical protein